MWPLLVLLVAPIADWPTWKPADCGYSIRMPPGALSKTESADDRPDKIEVRSLSAEENGLRFAVFRHELSAPVAVSKRQSILDKLRDGLVRSNNAAIRSESRTIVDGQPARDLVLDVAVETGGAAILRARIVLAGRAVYQLYAWAPEKKAEVPEIAEFLGSFRLDSSRDPANGPPFSAPASGFSARFPAPPSAGRKERVGDREWTVFESEAGGATFVVAHRDLPEALAKDPRRALDSARDELLGASLGVLKSERKIASGRDPGREIVAEVPSGDDPTGDVLAARLVLVGRRLYQVKARSAKGPPGPASCRAFLDSFRVDAAK